MRALRHDINMSLQDEAFPAGIRDTQSSYNLLRMCVICISDRGISLLPTKLHIGKGIPVNTPSTRREFLGQPTLAGLLLTAKAWETHEVLKPPKLLFPVIVYGCRETGKDFGLWHMLHPVRGHV
jgi:hypothetical protein